MVDKIFNGKVWRIADAHSDKQIATAVGYEQVWKLISDTMISWGWQP